MELIDFNLNITILRKTKTLIFQSVNSSFQFCQKNLSYCTAQRSKTLTKNLRRSKQNFQKFNLYPKFLTPSIIKFKEFVPVNDWLKKSFDFKAKYFFHKLMSLIIKFFRNNIMPITSLKITSVAYEHVNESIQIENS
jgi:hypothetical protein